MNINRLRLSSTLQIEANSWTCRIEMSFEEVFSFGDSMGKAHLWPIGIGEWSPQLLLLNGHGFSTICLPHASACMQFLLGQAWSWGGIQGIMLNGLGCPIPASSACGRCAGVGILQLLNPTIFEGRFMPRPGLDHLPEHKCSDV